MYKIAITGPESTGKSTLAKQLADHFKTLWVPEYSRKFLEQTDGKYTRKDLLSILEGQLDAENKLIKKANKFLFCDTDPLVIWIWSKVKYGKVDPVIENALHHHKYDLYLLMYPDLAWEKDKLRESEGFLLQLFELYLKKLDSLKYPFEIIRGVGGNRLQNVVDVLKKID